MLPNDEKLRFYFLLGGFFLVLGLVVILGFTYFRFQSLLTKTAPAPAENKYLRQLAQKEETKLKAEEATMPAQPKEVPENCLWVPLAQPPDTGIYMIDNEPKPSVYDFYYDGRLDEFKEVNMNGCDYYELTMFRRMPFILRVPKGMIQIGKRYSNFEPTFLEQHLGKFFQIRMSYFSPNQKNFSALKIEEWEILFMRINDYEIK